MEVALTLTLTLTLIGQEAEVEAAAKKAFDSIEALRKELRGA